MLTNTGETVSKEVMEKILLRNLELLKEVESLKVQLHQRDIAISLLTSQRDSFCTRYIRLTEEVKMLKEERKQE